MARSRDKYTVELTFVGEYDHSLDQKGRVILPAKFRERVQDGCYLTKVLDGCLAVYTPEEFKSRSEEMMEKARRGQKERNMVRTFSAGTAELVPDRQGRIAIPAPLREFARLERELKIIGAINRIEIWNKDSWIDINAQAEEAMRSPEPALDDLGL